MVVKNIHGDEFYGIESVKSHQLNKQKVIVWYLPCISCMVYFTPYIYRKNQPFM